MLIKSYCVGRVWVYVYGSPPKATVAVDKPKPSENLSVGSMADVCQNNIVIDYEDIQPDHVVI